MNAKLIFKDGTVFEGESFGYPSSVAGEVVFTTGMVGYPEAITDASYEGQILVFSYPLIGNYGVPDKKYWESERIHTTAIVVSSYIDNSTHHASTKTFREWLVEQQIPAIEIKDTRALVQKLRETGAMLGKIIIDQNVDWYDPNLENIVANVSVKKPRMEHGAHNMKHNNSKRRIVLIDCGAKKNIVNSLVNRGVEVMIVPWNYDVVSSDLVYDGVVLSNGPGDPKMLTETINNVGKILKRGIPTLGICLGNQLLALGAGGDTYKLKFGHRSQNQPCRVLDGTDRFYLTTQNHGFAVGKIPSGFTEWFTNANDGTNEGIIHKTKPFMSVQFHPEAFPGPNDTDWIFDEFIKTLTY